jgi:hypothetical protein
MIDLKNSINRLKETERLEKAQNIENADLSIKIKVLQRAYDNIVLNEIDRKSLLINKIRYGK